MITTVREYTKSDKKVVLVGAQHIATTGYYDRIQAILDSYPPDCVLYEGVGKDDSDDEDDLLGLKEIYSITAEWSGLQMQSEVIRRNKEWVNSDIKGGVIKNFSEQDFKKKMQEVLDAFRKLKEKMKKNPESEEKTKKMFRLLFRVMVKFLPVLMLFIRGGYLILDVRNGKVLVDILELLTDKNVAVAFYGEAHLRGLEKSLEKLGFKGKVVQKLNPLEE